MIHSKIIFIVGPTAVGKSEVAYHLAKKIGGEIISCDSMQVYKEIHIASNKPSEEILRVIPHHLLNIVSIEEEFDVAQFNQLAITAIRDIHARERIPIVVGGSGLYMEVLLDGIFEGGDKNEALRTELRQLAMDEGNQALYDKLKEIDPGAASKIHPNNIKRIIRALEVCCNEQCSISELQHKRQGIWGKYDIKLFVLNRHREALYKKINDRVDQMFDEGIIEEIRALEKKTWSYTAKGLIGVKEVLAYLSGDIDLAQAQYLMKRNTRHFAKRQLTWFRRDKRLEWMMIDAEDTAESVMEKIKNKGS